MTTDHFRLRASCLLILSGALCTQVARAQQAGDARDLVPAVAFPVSGGAALVDVAVQGDFPRAFRLVDLPEPPREAIVVTGELRAPEAWPDYALGFLTAVPRGHAPVLEQTRGGLDAQTCTATACTDQIHVCTADGNACADATLACNRVGKDCTITSISGDAELLRQSLHLFEGRARDISVLYVADDAPAGSLVSQLYAGGAELAGGYHLLERRETPDRAEDAAITCELDSQTIVLTQFNQQLGTHFERSEELTEYLGIKHFNELYGTHYERLSDVTESSLLAEDLDALMMRAFSAFFERTVRDMLARKCLIGTSGYAVAGPLDARTLTLPLIDPAPPKVGDGFLVGSPWRVGHTPLDWQATRPRPAP